MSAPAAGPAASLGIPPLTFSTGPSAADGTSSGSSSGATGEFFFGGRPTGFTDVLQSALPFLIIGGALWLTLRR